MIADVCKQFYCIQVRGAAATYRFLSSDWHDGTEKHLIVAGACPGQSRKNKWLPLYFRIMPRGLAIIRGIISYIKNSILFSALATSYFIGVWARAPGEPLGPGPRGTLGPGHVFRARFSGTFFGQVFRARFSDTFFRKL